MPLGKIGKKKKKYSPLLTSTSTQLRVKSPQNNQTTKTKQKKQKKSKKLKKLKPQQLENPEENNLWNTIQAALKERGKQTPKLYNNGGYIDVEAAASQAPVGNIFNLQPGHANGSQYMVMKPENVGYGRVRPLNNRLSKGRHIILENVLSNNELESPNIRDPGSGSTERRNNPLYQPMVPTSQGSAEYEEVLPGPVRGSNSVYQHMGPTSQGSAEYEEILQVPKQISNHPNKPNQYNRLGPIRRASTGTRHNISYEPGSTHVGGSKKKKKSMKGGYICPGYDGVCGSKLKVNSGELCSTCKMIKDHHNIQVKSRSRSGSGSGGEEPAYEIIPRRGEGLYGLRHNQSALEKRGLKEPTYDTMHNNGGNENNYNLFGNDNPKTKEERMKSMYAHQEMTRKAKAKAKANAKVKGIKRTKSKKGSKKKGKK
jgi:hypothetical protein